MNDAGWSCSEADRQSDETAYADLQQLHVLIERGDGIAYAVFRPDASPYRSGSGAHSCILSCFFNGGGQVFSSE